MASRSKNPVDSAKPADMPVCGLIMPISETQTYTEIQWKSVQILMHRSIVSAGFTPKNVWENTATDRISERIIGNIFEAPIVVADVTDLNPNVMLELGLRLASKKPTLVVAASGSTIPFDIRDFHALFYPRDMNMLEMEDFFVKIARALTEKYKAYIGSSYTPFLGSVIVDVARPETREVGVNEIIISRLDEISKRISHVESAARINRDLPQSQIRRNELVNAGKITAYIPDDAHREFCETVVKLREVDRVRVGSMQGNNRREIEIMYSGRESQVEMEEKIEIVVERFGGDTLPF